MRTEEGLLNEREQLERMATARFIAGKKWPPLIPMFYSMKMIYEPRINTLAVDRFGRMYFNPPESWTDDQLAGAIFHEASHLLREHHKRFNNHFDHKTNIATDAEINDDLKGMGVDLPEGAVFPSNYNLPDGLLAEEYLSMLPEHPPNDTDQWENGIAGDGFDCGSCTGGISRDYELPKDDKEVRGLSDIEIQSIQRQVAKEIKKSRGTLGGDWDVWANSIIDPHIDPLKILRSFVVGISQKGTDVETFRRPNKRYSESEIIFPGYAGKETHVTFLVDTSGSMGENDIGRSLGVIKRGLKNRTKLTVIVGDTRVTGEANVKDISKLRSVMKGGGGTSMDQIIIELDKRRGRKKPKGLIVLTDGYTPWPESKPSFPVAILLPTNVDDAPKWAKTIYIGDKGK